MEPTPDAARWEPSGPDADRPPWASEEDATAVPPEGEQAPPDEGAGDGQRDPGDVDQAPNGLSLIHI